ncbi:hypothetical protein [Kitasatospora purpeofusca]|uniref:hypothetical protein n=1 Tax=Kitasatospora purpeofusca TaxID=67352 RepID=UPI0038638FBC|nr:hypothetical protein OIP63_39180 [Kitasatospora purpeofusca]
MGSRDVPKIFLWADGTWVGMSLTVRGSGAAGYVGKAPGTSRDQYTADLTDTRIDGHHVLWVGPHLLISARPVLSDPGRLCLHITADAARPTGATVHDALAGLLTVQHRATPVSLHRLTNADGDYYSADPDFHPDGRFTALNIYPATGKRRKSGCTDATRQFLNILLDHKAARGLARRDPFPDATAGDIDAVLGASPVRRASSVISEQLWVSSLRRAVSLSRSFSGRVTTDYGTEPGLRCNSRSWK